ncbi:MAG: hypothetical protein OEP95_05340 [Myxococcales bacterium]|nr:hypothetical protein [Myxococcales bacterium]
MRRNRALYLAILLLAAITGGSVQAATWSEWDDGSAQHVVPVDFGAGEAAELKDDLDRQLRSIRARKARIDAAEFSRIAPSPADELSRELLEHEARLLVAAAAIAEVAGGAVRDPAEIAVRVDQALSAFEAAQAAAGRGAI